MDFSHTDDQRMLLETLSRFLSDKYDIEQRHGFAMSDDGYSSERWQEFAELGIIGALFTEEVGGFGGSGDDISLVFEQLGRALVVEPFLPTLLAGTILAKTGEAELLENVIAGNSLVALAHGEPSSRYDLAHVGTKATKEGDSWYLTGDKSVVLGGGNANVLIVSARVSGGDDDETGISLFIVEKSPQVTSRSYSTLDGYAAAELSFDKAEAKLIGSEENGFALIEKAFATGITAICAEALGAMEVVKDLTVEYMKTRKQFGVPIGQFQALQHRMADVLIELEQMRSAVINAAGHLNAGRIERERNASSAKYLSGTIGRQVAEEAIQIHGGMGMTWEYTVGHYAKHIIMIDHVLGDTDHHLERYIQLGKNKE